MIIPTIFIQSPHFGMESPNLSIQKKRAAVNLFTSVKSLSTLTKKSQKIRPIVFDFAHKCTKKILYTINE